MAADVDANTHLARAAPIPRKKALALIALPMGKFGWEPIGGIPNYLWLSQRLHTGRAIAERGRAGRDR